jgi:hypothetical protein
MTMFEAAARLRYEDELVAHLRTFAPRLSQLRGEACLTAIVQTGVGQASRYGFTNRGPMRFYIELMFTFGGAFDSDPQYPWIHDVLTGGDEADQMGRAALLYRRVNDYQDAVIGEDSDAAVSALRRIGGARLEDLVPDGRDVTHDGAILALRRFYPRKAKYLGGDALAALARSAFGRADAHGIATSRGRALLLGLMYGFGHGVIDDPLYPWVRGVLDQARIPDPAARVRRLDARTRIYIDRVLRHFAEPT